MKDSNKDFAGMGLAIGIIIFSGVIISPFIPSLVWAGIIAITTYPLYERWHNLISRNNTLSALLFTTLLGLLLLLPISWLASVLIRELQIFINYLQKVNHSGEKAPELLKEIPYFGTELINYWNTHIAKPGNIRQFLSDLHVSLTPASYYIKQISFNIAHRGVQVGFTLLALFFFYRDGNKLVQQIHQIGQRYLGTRWFHYAEKLPAALRATVNGTIMVGIGVGILMGICYLLVDFPAPTLMGFITAFVAMIPFMIPIVFAIVALILAVNGSLIGGIIVIIWGTIVMFIADHFVKPVLIGGATELPFLAVLFGILGGLELLGLLGLFIGPIVMGLFVTLWQELLKADTKSNERKLANQG